MKKILLILTLFYSLTSFAATENSIIYYNFPIIRITDGDTVTISAPFIPAPLKPELKIRIYGVDTPETGSLAKCQEEINKGKAATAFTRQKINESVERKVGIIQWDKYGGRVLGDIVLDGKSLRQMLVTSGYAREYYGGFKKSWCN